MPENANPLNKYFRQPAVFVTLPSGGNYPPHVLTQSQTGEIGVQPMTARDEIIFKTPDALMNGQGMVDVIQSCIPEIKDAWQISNYDLDTILIAIRIATYGETMDINFNVPGTTEKASHTLNLPSLLEQIKTTEVNNDIELKEILIVLSIIWIIAQVLIWTISIPIIKHYPSLIFWSSNSRRNHYIWV